MGTAKSLLFSVLGFIFIGTLAMVLLNLAKKVPLVGGVADKAQNLLQDGEL